MKDDVIIQKIVAYAEKVADYCADADKPSVFSSNPMLLESCVFNLSQIGELANKLSAEFTDLHPEIQWQGLYGLRNRIVHDYDGINRLLIWEIVKKDIPELIIKLKTL